MADASALSTASVHYVDRQLGVAGTSARATAAGSYTLSGSTSTVNGSGSDIWNAADAFQSVSQPLTGDGSITARVVSQTNTNVWAKAGVMFRETLTPGSTNAFAALTPGAGVVYQVRPSTGAAEPRCHLRSDRHRPVLGTARAGTPSPPITADGNTWTSLGQYTITMASQAYVDGALQPCQRHPGHRRVR